MEWTDEMKIEKEECLRREEQIERNRVLCDMMECLPCMSSFGSRGAYIFPTRCIIMMKDSFVFLFSSSRERLGERQMKASFLGPKTRQAECGTKNASRSLEFWTEGLVCLSFSSSHGMQRIVYSCEDARVGVVDVYQPFGSLTGSLCSAQTLSLPLRLEYLQYYTLLVKDHTLSHTVYVHDVCAWCLVCVFRHKNVSCHLKKNWEKAMKKIPSKRRNEKEKKAVGP